jgi:hypothetical protein
MSKRSAGHQPELIEEVVEGVLFGSVDDSAKWATLTATDALVVRNALIRAQQLRETDADPGNAYLAGIADATLIMQRLALGQETLRLIQSLAETPEQRAG